MDDKYLDEKFKSLPLDIQEALTSTEVAEQVKKIGQKYFLKIDQESILFDRISDILLGITSSKRFVEIFSRDAHVDQKTAFSIAEDVNKEIFDKIRASMQVIEKGIQDSSPTKRNADLSILEKVGGISVEKNEVELDESLPRPQDKEKILSDLENPMPGNERTVPKEVEAKTEPLVDRLLSTPTAQAQEKVVVQAPIQPAAAPKAQAPAPQQETKPDPYKEPV